ncbi:hypothetical protein [Paracoccus sp. S-4012]|uniref:hypothetical protein n=1 Tax=Paracoccus sp. S-4012 TaxID=2665648 RepID=UPI001E2C5C89|nr:hypothetical protein [Paracoccus sp. S-4012]
MATNPMDWEAAMTATRTSAEKAALYADRTVGGVAQMLDQQRRLSSLMADLTKAQTKAESRLSELLERTRTVQAARRFANPSRLLLLACGSSFLCRRSCPPPSRPPSAC